MSRQTTDKHVVTSVKKLYNVEYIWELHVPYILFYGGPHQLVTPAANIDLCLQRG